MILATLLTISGASAHDLRSVGKKLRDCLDLARTAEAAHFDMLLVESEPHVPAPRLEPFALLPAVSAATRMIRLAGTAPVFRRREHRCPLTFVQGSSDSARELAARTADLIVAAEAPRPDALGFVADLGSRLASHGRARDELLVLPIIFPVAARTRTEALDKSALLRERIPTETAIRLFADRIGADFDALPADAPIPPTGGRVRFRQTLDQARANGLTLAEVARQTFASGHWHLAGTADDIVDQLEDRFLNGAADGFTILPAPIPGGLDDFVTLVLPELARRGLFWPKRADRAPAHFHLQQGTHP